MQDMLVKLYELPEITPLQKKMEEEEIFIRTALAAEKSIVVEWVKKRFDEGWASEAEVCFSYQPVSCYIAIYKGEIIGFAAYDAAYRNFFGPTGVDKAYRGKGIGKILLMRCLISMKELGYAYAIIGGVGPARFYEKAVNATLIEGSNPGIYTHLLSEIPDEAH